MSKLLDMRPGILTFLALAFGLSCQPVSQGNHSLETLLLADGSRTTVWEPRILYLVGYSSPDLWAFQVDSTTGALTQIFTNTSTLAAVNALNVVVDSTNGVLYVPRNINPGGLRSFSVSEAVPVPGTVSTNTAGVAFSHSAVNHPTLPMTYVVDTGGNVLVYSRTAAGVFGAPSTFAIGTPTGSYLTISPGARFLFYRANSIIRTAPISSAGTLSTAVGSYTSTGNGYLVSHPDGRFVYVTGTNSIDLLQLGDDGSLTLISQTATPNLNIPFVIHPNGKYLYMTDSTGTAYVYWINKVTGALLLLQQISVNNSAPQASCIDVRGRFYYTFGSGAGNIATAFRINDTNGTLSQTAAYTLSTSHRGCAFLNAQVSRSHVELRADEYLPSWLIL
ncbi:MAG TPA: beta-propeller fold lactonase family protein [Leptospiraceae bacterium]|nr:beta-propeller fold lactonase family protein [Leptospiraceae bacterium]